MSQFGQYRLLRRLAVGGMGEIYLAKLERGAGFEKILAIKRILPTLSDDPAFVAMFNREAVIAAQLIHQNIVQIFDYGQHAGAYFIAMEYVHGRDLRTIIESSAARGEVLSPPLAMAILTAACAGLDYAHRYKELDGRPIEIIHRDVSPQNILVSHEGAVKLTDFGLAQRVDVDSIKDGQIQGKFAYMSPEQTFGDKLDRRSDIFSLGIVAYEMFCGVRPFVSKDLTELMLAIRKGIYRPPSEVRPELPKTLDDVLAPALASEPQDRYKDARAFLDALENLSRSEGWLASSSDIGDLVSRLCPDRSAQMNLAGGGTQVSGQPIGDGISSGTQVSGQPISVPTNPLGNIPMGTQAAADPIASSQPSVPSGLLLTGDPLGSADTAPSIDAASDPFAAHTPTSQGIPPQLAPPPSAQTDRRPLQTWMAMGAMVLLAGVTGALIVTSTQKTIVEPADEWRLDLRQLPDGAEVYVDGERQGSGPLVVSGLEGGRKVEVSVRQPGFKTYNETIDLAKSKQGGTMLLKPELVPAKATGHVIIKVDPPDAFLLVDGKKVEPEDGKQGVFNFHREPGFVDIKIVHDGFKPYQHSHQIDGRTTTTIPVKLAPRPMRVEIRPNNKANLRDPVSVTIDGPGYRNTCNLPCSQTLPEPGRVQIRATFAGIAGSKPFMAAKTGKAAQKLIFVVPIPTAPKEASARLTASLSSGSEKKGLLGADLLRRNTGGGRVALDSGTQITLRYVYAPASKQVSLTVVSDPYSSVAFNGSAMGDTPQIIPAVGPGNHTLSLVDKKSGKPVSIRLRFTQDAR